jgi:hypothetical protein
MKHPRGGFETRPYVQALERSVAKSYRWTIRENSKYFFILSIFVSPRVASLPVDTCKVNFSHIRSPLNFFCGLLVNDF